jgi:protein TonB
MSKNTNIYDNNWIDIVFENRNHEYGAYQIRKSSNRNSILGIVGMFSFLGLAFGAILLFSSFKDKYIDAPSISMPQDTFFILRPEMFPIEEPEIEIIPASAGFAVPEEIESIALVEPEIVVDNSIPSELLPPTQEEMAGKTIASTTNTEGTGGENAEPTEGAGAGGDGTGTGTGTGIGLPNEIGFTAAIMPEFPGGEQALLNYVKSKSKFTQTARENNISGTMYVSFVVNEKGKVVLSKIERGLGFGMDEMLLNVVNTLPDFTPAEQNGRKVKIRMMLPVKFELN